MKTIMVATDFSERSDRALRRATLIARQTGAGLILVHVVDDDQPHRIVDHEHSDAAKLLRRQAQTLSEVDSVAATSRVVLDAPFAGILRAAAEIAPDLLVIGPHRRRVLQDVFTGTTAERTIRAIGLPVLMVNAPPAGAYGHVLLTTDLSAAAGDALARFAALGLTPDARQTLLHVFEPPTPHLYGASALPRAERDRQAGIRLQQADRALVEFMAGLPDTGAVPMVRPVGGAVASEVLAAAEAGDADLIVAATHGRSGLARLFLGSVTEAVLRASGRDVLAIPPRSAG
jgi:nucleotide-binding universal stress UspA family protein